MASAEWGALASRTGLQARRQACSVPQRSDEAYRVLPLPSRPVSSDGVATRSAQSYSAHTAQAYVTVDSVKGVGGSVDSSHKSGLPDFKRPPLVEVAVGLMFEPLPISAITLAQLYLQWQEDYPSFEEHPAIPSSPAVPGLIFDVNVPRIRFWFLNNSGGLIQVQRDRLIVNWRKEAESAEYPHYDSLRDEFHKRVDEFSAFLASHQQGPLKPNAIEVTYVNQVPLAGESPNLSDIVSLLQPPPNEVGSPVEANLSVRFDASAQLDREPAALLINVQRSSTVEPPLAVLQLSCTIPVRSLSDAYVNLNKARDHVVQPFRSITTDKMHEEWGIG